MKISEAYLLFGFKDYSGFYKAFRKEYGMSPKEWQETVMNIPEFNGSAVVSDPYIISMYIMHG